MNFNQYLEKVMTDFGLELSEKQMEQFRVYTDYLLEINKVINLTAITEPEEIAVKHIVDSLSCYDPDYFKSGSTILDLGSGAGFPGVPLAVWDSSLQITFFDSLQKRVKFLVDVKNKLGLSNAQAVHGRAEEKAHDEAYRENYDVVTSRAVARLPVLLEWALPYVRENGYFVALKGALYEEELAESKNALAILGGKIAAVKKVNLPGLTDKRAVIYIKKVKSTPKRYPRKPKEIKVKSL